MRRIARTRTAARTTRPAGRPHRSWLQVSCSLFADHEGALYVPWKRLSAALEHWRGERRFELCFFLRKPPGLRLRFHGEELGERLEPELVTLLDAAERANDVRGFRFGIYEPESFRFGGPAGMAIAHDLFDRDSCTTVTYETLAEADRRGLPRDLFSLFLTNDLFARSLDDRAEIWDVWQHLGLTLGAPTPTPNISARACARAREAVTLASTFKDGLCAAATELLDRASKHNEHVAQRLRAVNSAGRLTVGLRAWLTAATVFHWNRLALTNADLGTMVAAMVRLSCPHDPI